MTGGTSHLLPMTPAEAAIYRRDNRPCACGHRSISHGSYTCDGHKAGVGDGPCGLCDECDALTSTS